MASSGTFLLLPLFLILGLCSTTTHFVILICVSLLFVKNTPYYNDTPPHIHTHPFSLLLYYHSPHRSSFPRFIFNWLWCAFLSFCLQQPLCSRLNTKNQESGKPDWDFSSCLLPH